MRAARRLIRLPAIFIDIRTSKRRHRRRGDKPSNASSADDGSPAFSTFVRPNGKGSARYCLATDSPPVRSTVRTLLRGSSIALSFSLYTRSAKRRNTKCSWSNERYVNRGSIRCSMRESMCTRRMKMIELLAFYGRRVDKRYIRDETQSESCRQIVTSIFYLINFFIFFIKIELSFVCMINMDELKKNARWERKRMIEVAMSLFIYFLLEYLWSAIRNMGGKFVKDF